MKREARFLLFLTCWVLFNEIVSAEPEPICYDFDEEDGWSFGDGWDLSSQAGFNPAPELAGGYAYSEDMNPWSGVNNLMSPTLSGVTNATTFSFYYYSPRSTDMIYLQFMEVGGNNGTSAYVVKPAKERQWLSISLTCEDIIAPCCSGDAESCVGNIWIQAVAVSSPAVDSFSINGGVCDSEAASTTVSA